MVNGAMPFAHSAASSRFSDAVVSSRGMPQTTANRQFYSRPGPSAGASRVGASAGNSGGWRRLNGNTGGGNYGGGAPQARVPGGSSVPAGQGYRSVPQNTPQSAARPGAGQQSPLRINPPIVQNRGSSGGSSSRSPSRGGSSAGGHASGGGGHGGGHR
jgi:hypothetical protein